MSGDVDKILGAMTLRHKVGQLFCLGFSGAYPHPDILDAIERYHPAGFRVTPTARKFRRYLPAGHPGAARIERAPEPLERLYGSTCLVWRQPLRDYARVLNTLRQRSIDTGAGVPVYYSCDFEGGGSADIFDDHIRTVPTPMGLAATGDLELTRQVGWLVARQVRTVGIDWLHGPCLDVNTRPENPEINVRSFSPHADVCARFGRALFEGYRDGGIVATGKHFPGRGHSLVDAHYDVPVVEESAQRMNDVHLAPYREAIAAGLPAVMLAHTAYPALDPSGEIATVSKPIVTGVLRERLGFDGVILTDSFTMGGLVGLYDVAEAVVRAVEAGVDLILLKDENALRGEAYAAVLDAVAAGRLSEGRIDQSVRRVLEVKRRYGLLETGGLVDPDQVDAALAEPALDDIHQRACRRTVLSLRHDELLPLRPGARVLVIEQCSGFHRLCNNQDVHVGTLYEALLERGVEARYTNYDDDQLDRAMGHIEHLLPQVDAIVHTGYFYRGERAWTDTFARIERLGKPTVFVTNTPYPLSVLGQMQNVVVQFAENKRSKQAVADVLLGRAEAASRLGFDPTKTY